jgi:hypothetical protein
MSRVLYLRANRWSIMTNSSPSGHNGFFVYEPWRGQLLRSQRMRLPRSKRSYGVVQPLLLSIRRPLVAICGHGADDARLVQEVQAAKLAVFLYSLGPLFFEDCAPLVCTWCAEANPSAEGLIFVVRHIHMYTNKRRIALGVS